MGRIGFYPPDSPYDPDEPDDPPAECIGTGHHTSVTVDEDESDEVGWVWEFDDRNVALAVKVGRWVLVLGRHG